MQNVVIPLAIKNLAWKMFAITLALKGPGYGVNNDHMPETKQQYVDRVATISTAIAIESADHAPDWGWGIDSMAWNTYTTAFHESGRFNVRVHDGRWRGDNGRSVCLGQIMSGGEELVGIDMASTRRCVSEIMRILKMHKNRCLAKNAKESMWAVGRIYAGYMTGHSCDPKVKFVSGRMYTWNKVRKTKLPKGKMPAILSKKFFEITHDDSQ